MEDVSLLRLRARTLNANIVLNPIITLATISIYAFPRTKNNEIVILLQRVKM